ncbi:MAG: hypothetical protein MHM6MM_003208 [Cercozoa sp. M6MM]
MPTYIDASGNIVRPGSGAAQQAAPHVPPQRHPLAVAHDGLTTAEPDAPPNVPPQNGPAPYRYEERHRFELFDNLNNPGPAENNGGNGNGNNGPGRHVGNDFESDTCGCMTLRHYPFWCVYNLCTRVMSD